MRTKKTATVSRKLAQMIAFIRAELRFERSYPDKKERLKAMIQLNRVNLMRLNGKFTRDFASQLCLLETWDNIQEEYGEITAYLWELYEAYPHINRSQRDLLIRSIATVRLHVDILEKRLCKAS